MGQRTVEDWEKIAVEFTKSSKSGSGFPDVFLSLLNAFLEVSEESKQAQKSLLEHKYKKLENRFQQRVRRFLNNQRKKAGNSEGFKALDDSIKQLKVVADLDEFSDVQTLRLALNLTINFFDKNFISLQTAFDNEIEREEYETTASSEDSLSNVVFQGLTPDELCRLEIIDKLQSLYNRDVFDQLPKKVHDALNKMDPLLNEWIDNNPQLFYSDKNEEYELKE